MQIPVFGSPYPRELRDELSVYAEEFETLRAVHGARLSRYKKYRDELELSRTNELERFSDDYGQRQNDPNTPQKHAVALPFGQALTVKHAHRIAGRMPDVVCDRREETAYERYRSQTIERLVWGTMRTSNAEVQFSSGAWDASQCGSCVFDLWFDPNLQLPRFREIDPASFLEVPGATEPHDFTRAYRFWEAPVVSLRAEYAGKSVRDIPIPIGDISGNRKEGVTELALVVQMCSPTKVMRFAIGGNRPVLLYEEEHALGFVPYVVIPNVGPERAIWGWSDYEFVRDLCHYLPKLFSREADLIRQVANGVYLHKGVGLSGGQLLNIFRRGGFIPGKREATIAPVETAEVPQFEPQHHDKALLYLKMLGFSPNADWGDSAATSGSDRSLQLAPSFQLSGLKQINWSSGLSRLFGYSFKMLESKQTRPAYVSGVVRSSASRKQERFGFQFGPTAEAETQAITEDEELAQSVEPLPTTAKELFGGDYNVSFVWQNKVDPDDPAYVASELNKFQQGAQSLETTLVNLGCQVPEDEMKKIEKESARFPWIRQGQIALFKAAQENQQGQGGGAPAAGGDMQGAVDAMTQKDGQALDTDGLFGSLPGGGSGVPYGGA